jgi:hypothetical protein
VGNTHTARRERAGKNPFFSGFRIFYWAVFDQRIFQNIFAVFSL